MKSKTMRDLMIDNKFDIQSVGEELLADANNLIKTRKCETDVAKRSCYIEQIQKYESALKQYEEWCTKNNTTCVQYDKGAMQAWFSKQGNNIARIIGLSAEKQEHVSPYMAKVLEDKRVRDEAYGVVRKLLADWFDVVAEEIRNKGLKPEDLKNPRPLNELASEMTVELVVEHMLEHAVDKAITSPVMGGWWQQTLSSAISGYKAHANFDVSYINDTEKFAVVYMNVAFKRAAKAIKIDDENSHTTQAVGT